MQLYHQKLGNTGKNIIIIHGLFGSSDNWLSIGKILAEKYQVYLIDQRNHGKSPHGSIWNYQAMADDLQEFILTQQIEEPILLGHSMGGKTAMQFVFSYPNIASKLIVADIAPKPYPLHHQQILEGLQAIHLDLLQSRKEAEDMLSRYVSEFGIRAFLLKNLYKNEEEKWAWRINLKVIAEQIANVGESFSTNKTCQVPTLFIRGALSNYIKDEDIKQIHQYFPAAQIATIQAAGHWLHAEKPQEFIEIVQNFL